MQRFFAMTSPYFLWLVLASLGIMMTFTSLTSTDPKIYHELVHPAGETSARLLIVLMMATPLTLLLKGWRGPLWLKRNRRYLGVAAFGYALLHTVFYLIDKASLSTVVDELPRLYIWTGWVAFIIFVPLALTSMDYFVRKMGTWWKWLQRWTYLKPTAFGIGICDHDRHWLRRQPSLESWADIDGHFERAEVLHDRLLKQCPQWATNANT